MTNKPTTNSVPTLFRISDSIIELIKKMEYKFVMDSPELQQDNLNNLIYYRGMEDDKLFNPVHQGFDVNAPNFFIQKIRAIYYLMLVCVFQQPDQLANLKASISSFQELKRSKDMFSSQILITKYGTPEGVIKIKTAFTMLKLALYNSNAIPKSRKKYFAQFVQLLAYTPKNTTNRISKTINKFPIIDEILIDCLIEIIGSETVDDNLNIEQSLKKKLGLTCDFQMFREFTIEEVSIKVVEKGFRIMENKNFTEELAKQIHKWVEEYGGNEDQIQELLDVSRVGQFEEDVFNKMDKSYIFELQAFNEKQIHQHGQLGNQVHQKHEPSLQFKKQASNFSSNTAPSDYSQNNVRVYRRISNNPSQINQTQTITNTISNTQSPNTVQSINTISKGQSNTNTAQSINNNTYNATHNKFQSLTNTTHNTTQFINNTASYKPKSINNQASNTNQSKSNTQSIKDTTGSTNQPSISRRLDIQESQQKPSTPVSSYANYSIHSKAIESKQYIENSNKYKKQETQNNHSQNGYRVYNLDNKTGKKQSTNIQLTPNLNSTVNSNKNGTVSSNINGTVNSNFSLMTGIDSVRYQELKTNRKNITSRIQYSPKTVIREAPKQFQTPLTFKTITKTNLSNQFTPTMRVVRNEFKSPTPVSSRQNFIKANQEPRKAIKSSDNQEMKIFGGYKYKTHADIINQYKKQATKQHNTVIKREIRKTHEQPQEQTIPNQTKYQIKSMNNIG